MYVMHLAPSGDKAATVQIAAMPAGARAAVEKGETLTIGAPLMPCRSFAVPCLRPSVPWHHLQAALLSVFLTAVVLLPIKSARLGRRARFALPPPTLAVLSISRT